MIRVLHPITRLIVGGAQENTMFTAALLDREHFYLEIVSGPQTGSEGSLIEEIRGRGIPLTILPQLRREISPLNDFIATWKLYHLIKTGGFSIVHTHSSKAGLLGRLAARLAGTPIIIHTVHGWSFHDHMASWLRKTYIVLEKWAAQFTNTMIVVTERDIEKGLKEGIGRPEQYRLIRSAIPLADFHPFGVEERARLRVELGIPESVPVLGNVGRFSPQKNPLDWVQVASRVADVVPDCHFLLVGDGPLRSEIEAQLRATGLKQRTVLTGLRRDVPRLMAAMDVFLLTSLWEGLPRVIPQAMAMGLPVVANRADGTVEAIQHGETGYLCTPGDLDGMAAYCLELLQNPLLRKTLGQNGRQYITQEYDLRNMIAQIESLYAELLSVQQGKSNETERNK
ncbi:MAG TPA: hypothetical protein DEH22_17220 [Chloroflexi bacterium]|nr:hypothetical protein [Chloroflexota bacterium]